MGFFDAFKKKQPAAEAPATEQSAAQQPAAAASPWPKKFRGFRDWEDDKKKTVGLEFLADVGGHFESSKVKEMLDEDDLELRGRVAGVPVRVKYELDMGWVSLEMKCDSPIEELALEWDLEKVPVHSDDEDDDDWDEDDEVRVFVGKGVFVEGDKSEVQQILATFQALPDGLPVEIVTLMERHKLTRFSVYPGQISVGFDDNSYEMADPIAEITEVTALMAKLAQTIGSGTYVPRPSTTSGGIAVIPVQLVTCAFCTTKFNLGANSRCPNCGASHGS